MLRSTLVAVAVLLFTSCSDDTLPPLPDEPATTLGVAAGRPADVRVPSDYDSNTEYPLVVLLHGYSATGGLQNLYFGLSNQVTALGFILVIPDGTANSDGARFWNATNSCCDFENSKVDDVAYLTAVIDDAIARYGADPRRVYLVGHSNGGYMAYRMACDRADRIAGIASLAGANWKDTSRCRPSVPVPVVQIHGTKDDNVPYAGNVVTPTAKESVASFAATNGYTGDVTPQFKRRVVPVGSYIIATEELSPDLAKSLSPANRSFADTRRVLGLGLSASMNAPAEDTKFGIFRM